MFCLFYPCGIVKGFSPVFIGASLSRAGCGVHIYMFTGVAFATVCFAYQIIQKNKTDLKT